jgi:hypothetical protein
MCKWLSTMPLWYLEAEQDVSSLQEASNSSANEMLTTCCADESHLQFTIHHGHWRNRPHNKSS